MTGSSRSRQRESFWVESRWRRNLAVELDCFFSTNIGSNINSSLNQKGSTELHYMRIVHSHSKTSVLPVFISVVRIFI